MHGQYDWMRDPAHELQDASSGTTCARADQWRHSHNYMHHTFTNILGKDRDIGYGILRMEDQPEVAPVLPGQPGVRVRADDDVRVGRHGVHDLEAENIVKGTRKLERRTSRCSRAIWKQGRQAGAQGLPAVPGCCPGPLFVPTTREREREREPRSATSGRSRSSSAGTSRPATATFTRGGDGERVTGTSGTCARCSGSANITGSPLFHILSGNLSHQIEHHLFPDIPARRYPQIAAEVEALCEKYGLPYNTGRFSKQIGSTWGKIFRLAVPFGGRSGSDDPTVDMVEDELAAAAA